MKNLTLVVTFLLSVHLCYSQQKEPCTVEVSGEAGVHSSYNDRELGETIYPGRVGQQYVEVTICANKKFSFGAWEWTSTAFKRDQPEAAEVDLVGFVNFKVAEKTDLRGEAGVYFVPGGRIQRFSSSLYRELTLGTKDTAEFENTIVYFRTIDNLPYKGGVVNRTSLTANKTFFKDRFKASVTSGLGLDNNPFDMGRGKFVGIAYTSGRLAYNVNSSFSVYVEGLLTTPVFGVTDRGVRKVGSFGIAFSF